MTEKLLTGTLSLNTNKHMDSGQMYHVYQNQAAAPYSSLYFFIFLSLQFSTLKFFVTLFSGTARDKMLKQYIETIFMNRFNIKGTGNQDRCKILDELEFLPHLSIYFELPALEYIFFEATCPKLMKNKSLLDIRCAW